MSKFVLCKRGRITSLPLCKRKLGVKFISSSEEYGETVALISSKRKSSQEGFSDREDFSSELQLVLGNNEPLFRFSNLESSIKSFFEEHEDYMLAEATSELRKQECRTDFLDSSVRDLQRQLGSNRLEIGNVNYGYQEPRTEQARLHEELAQRERVLRETQIRSIHEVGELKRAQEMRIDEFSRNELTDAHATIQEVTSQIQELQERMNYIK